MFTPIGGGIRVVGYATRRAVVRTFTRMALPAGRRSHFCLLALGVPQWMASVAGVSWGRLPLIGDALPALAPKRCALP